MIPEFDLLRGRNIARGGPKPWLSAACLAVVLACQFGLLRGLEGGVAAAERAVLGLRAEVARLESEVAPVAREAEALAAAVRAHDDLLREKESWPKWGGFMSALAALVSGEGPGPVPVGLVVTEVTLGIEGARDRGGSAKLPQSASGVPTPGAECLVSGNAREVSGVVWFVEKLRELPGVERAVLVSAEIPDAKGRAGTPGETGASPAYRFTVKVRFGDLAPSAGTV